MKLSHGQSNAKSVGLNRPQTQFQPINPLSNLMNRGGKSVGKTRDEAKSNAFFPFANKKGSTSHKKTRKSSKKRSKSPTKEDKAREALMKHKLKQLSLEKQPSLHLNADQMQANMLKNMILSKMKNMVDKQVNELSRHEQLWLEKGRLEGNPNKMHKK